MPNNYLSVLYKHIIQVENKNVGLKVGGQTYHCPPPPAPITKVGAHAPLAHLRFLRQCVCVCVYIYVHVHVHTYSQTSITRNKPTVPAELLYEQIINNFDLSKNSISQSIVWSHHKDLIVFSKTRSMYTDQEITTHEVDQVTNERVC